MKFPTNLAGGAPALQSTGVLTDIDSTVEKATERESDIKEMVSVKLQRMEEEIQFWKEEIQVYLRLTNKLDRKKIDASEQKKLTEMNKGFQHLLASLLPPHLNKLDILKQSKRSSKGQLAQLENNHQKLRSIHQKLKQLCLPVLPKMIPLSIF